MAKNKLKALFPNKILADEIVKFMRFIQPEDADEAIEEVTRICGIAFLQGKNEANKNNGGFVY